MKNVIQLSLIFLLIFFVYFTYDEFLTTKPITKSKLQKNEITKDNNNLIKNLAYEVNMLKGLNYHINALSGEIIDDNYQEQMRMKNVTAKVFDKNNQILIITARIAIYNNQNHNTEFKNDVKIKFEENIIYSDKLYLNFNQNYIKIFDNVKFENEESIMLSDNIMIGLLDKKINIFMNDKENKVILSKKK